MSATGALSEPKLPELPGLETFQGKVFHSARWDHSHSLSGKKVGVIGTGASAIQFVPFIQPEVKQLTLFQRTPPWIVPTSDRKLSDREHRLLSGYPWIQKIWRRWIYFCHELTGFGFRHPALMRVMTWVSMKHLERQVPDPSLRKKLTPKYTIGCKRILISNRYYPALTQNNVEVVTEPILKIGPFHVETSDGTKRDLDTLILGTGFDLAEIHSARTIIGKTQRTLYETWNESPQAFLGTTVFDFPNLFLLLGPNTGLGHSSVMLMAEAQIEYVLKAIQWMRDKKIQSVEPRLPAQERYNQKLVPALRRSVWASGCQSWYLDPTGRNSALWPHSIGAFRRRLRKFRPQDFLVKP